MLGSSGVSGARRRRVPARDRAGDSVDRRSQFRWPHIPPRAAVDHDLRLGVTQKGFPRDASMRRSRADGRDAETTGDGTPVGRSGAPQQAGRSLRGARNKRPCPELDGRDARSRRLITRDRSIATPLRDDQSGVLLPLIDLAAISTHREGRRTWRSEARKRSTPTSRDSSARTRCLRPIESSWRPSSSRGAFSVFQPRSKTMSIVVFLGCMFATVDSRSSWRMRARASRRRVSADAELRDTDQRRTA